ncbi:MAG TPA: phytanoyl-CoA dioxygenase family protein, partial [Thalassobaculum sp.]
MHIPPLSTIATTADRDQAEAALIRDGAVAFPAVFPDDRIGALRDGLEAAVRTSAETLAGKGMPVPEAGIAHHVLPSHPSFAGLIEDLPGAELLSRFLGGSFILNSFGGLLNRPATPGAYLHRWHRDLRAFSASDDIRLMINMLITLDPFSEANGGTLLDLGSHRTAERDAAAARVV